MTKINLLNSPIIIPLTHGKFTIIDTEDYFSIGRFKWGLSDQGYAIRTDNNGKNIRMHRIVINPPVNLEVDHINRNKLDNRRENLRIATRSQNQHNTPPRKNNKSGFKGVSWSNSNQKWLVNITSNSKMTHIGFFNTKEEAARAYNIAAQERFGEFAYLNQL